MRRFTSVLAAVGLALVAVTCDAGDDAALGSATEGGVDTGGTGPGGPVGDTFDDATAGAGPAEPAGTPGCGREPGAVLDGVLLVGAQERTFIVELPPDYDSNKAYPLVFVWHAWAASGADAQMTQQVTKHWGGNVIVVYPDGLPEPESGFEGWVTDVDGRDFAFFDLLYDAMAQELCFDRNRVFTQGYSRGAYMANYLACHRGSLIRGVASISGGGPRPGSTCEGPMASILFHGEIDPMVPILQGQQSRDRWRAENGCTDQVLPIGAHSTCVAYQGCEPGYPVVWCVHEKDHLYVGWAAQPIADFFRGL